MAYATDLERLRKCFQPRQWFQHEGEPNPDTVNEEDTFMWVYRRDADTSKYLVGYFLPDKSWFTESSYDTAEQAAARVRWLYGGPT